MMIDFLFYLDEKYRASLLPDLGPEARERHAIRKTFERVRHLNDSQYQPNKYQAVKKITDEFFKEF